MQYTERVNTPGGICQNVKSGSRILLELKQPPAGRRDLTDVGVRGILVLAQLRLGALGHAATDRGTGR